MLSEKVWSIIYCIPINIGSFLQISMGRGWLAGDGLLPRPLVGPLPDPLTGGAGPLSLRPLDFRWQIIEIDGVMAVKVSRTFYSPRGHRHVILVIHTQIQFANVNLCASFVTAWVPNSATYVRAVGVFYILSIEIKSVLNRKMGEFWNLALFQAVMSIIEVAKEIYFNGLFHWYELFTDSDLALKNQGYDSKKYISVEGLNFPHFMFYVASNYMSSQLIEGASEIYDLKSNIGRFTV